MQTRCSSRINLNFDSVRLILILIFSQIELFSEFLFKSASAEPLPATVPMSTLQIAFARSACLSALTRRFALSTATPDLFQLPARSITAWLPRMLALCENDALADSVRSAVIRAWLETWSDPLVEEQLLLGTVIFQYSSRKQLNCWFHS